MDNISAGPAGLGGLAASRSGGGEVDGVIYGVLVWDCCGWVPEIWLRYRCTMTTRM